MNDRLEAFCDGVFAFALTLLIVDLHPPEVSTTPQLWSALAHLGPTVFAFLLSFTVILITWISHHHTLSLVNRNTPAFLYANGLVLLGVVCVPFTTSLMGDYLLSAAAAPGVALYDATLAVQAVGWIAVAGVALKDGLAIDQAAAMALKKRRNNGFGALGLYAPLGVVALWFPRTVAAVTALSWLVWLGVSLRSPHEQSAAA